MVSKVVLCEYSLILSEQPKTHMPNALDAIAQGRD